MYNTELLKYVEFLHSQKETVISEMEEFAKNNQIPIMEPLGIEAILQILRIMNPKKVLEIGTAIGYSAIRMAKALPETTIITIERDEKRYEQALYYIDKTCTSHQIEVIFGDALTIYPLLKEHHVDVIFIDAAKGQNKQFFELYESFLTNKGVIITDNVLFKGFVTKEEIDSRSLRGIVNKIKDYNEWLKHHPSYETVFLPIGDGIAISKKKRVRIYEKA